MDILRALWGLCEGSSVSLTSFFSKTVHMCCSASIFCLNSSTSVLSPGLCHTPLLSSELGLLLITLTMALLCCGVCAHWGSVSITRNLLRYSFWSVSSFSRTVVILSNSGYRDHTGLKGLVWQNMTSAWLSCMSVINLGREILLLHVQSFSSCSLSLFKDLMLTSCLMISNDCRRVFFILHLYFIVFM